MQKLIKKIALALTLSACLLLGGCSGNVGVGLSVGVPIGQRPSIPPSADRHRHGVGGLDVLPWRSDAAGICLRNCLNRPQKYQTASKLAKSTRSRSVGNVSV